MTVDVSKFLRPVTLPILPSRKARKLLPKLTGKFLGPIPEAWAVKASEAGGRYRSRSALLVGLILWREHRFNNGDDRPVKLTKARLRALRVGRYSARNALDALEKAGLVSVQRFRHRSPLVMILNKADG
jgi:hypothetical protein